MKPARYTLKAYCGEVLVAQWEGEKWEQSGGQSQVKVHESRVANVRT